MKRLAAVALLLLVALVQATVQPTFRFTEEDLESDETLWDLYGRWAADHGVVREPSRFPTFKANARRQHSKKMMGLNVFGDRSLDEFKSCVREDELAMDQQLAVVDLDLVRPAADLLSWTSSDLLPISSRKSTGGRHTRSLIHAIKTQSAAVSLSAQYLLDCTIYMDGTSDCTGGSRLSALHLVQRTGIPIQSVYPYKGVQGITCDATNIYTSGVTVKGWSQVKKLDVTSMKQAVSLKPILVNIGVDNDFMYWGDHKVSGNVYHGPGSTNLTHSSVVIVGYDVDDLGGLYWIVKNSWGPRWGDDGYIFISAAANDGFVGPAGVAGILKAALFVETGTYE
ncbi:unnamed protein product [Urochloa decumbens]|uniref:Peptidase C1A papain C-terminal domain-containing protein n=1 Tax=Urochloa decumbens TaxID=240449 RepID=A0ABC9GX43_9POAL